MPAAGQPGARNRVNESEAAMSAERILPTDSDTVRLLVDAAPVMMYLSDPSGRVTYVNKLVLEFLSGSGQLPEGTAWAELIHPGDLAHCIRTHTNAVESQCGYAMECRALHASGKYRWLLARAAPVRNPAGTFLGLAGAVMDVTDQKLAASTLVTTEADLSSFKSKYRVVADNTYDWEFWMGPDGRFLYSSPSCQRVTGRHADEFAEDPGLLLRIIHPEDRQRYESHRLEEAAQRTTDDLQIRLCLPDGATRWVAHACQPVFDEQGRFQGTRGSNRDITGHKEAESEVRRLRQALSQVARINTVGQLTALVAHEVNQPLAAILSNAQAALRHLSAPTPDLREVHEILADIVSDDQRAGEIIQRLRNMLEHKETKIEALDMNDLIQEVVQLVHHDTLARDVSTSLLLQQDLPLVKGDRVQLQQVVLNLIVNAIEAMKDNPSSERKLTLRTSAADCTYVTVTVKDQGCGIAAENLEAIFEPFYSGRSGGMGLGLAICRTIVDAHGGCIWASSGAGRGAIFRFSIPCEEGP